MKDFEKEFDEIEKMKEDFAGYYYHNVPDLYQIQEWFSEYLTVSTNRTEEKMQKKIKETLQNLEAPYKSKYDLESLHEGFFSAIEKIKKNLNL